MSTSTLAPGYRNIVASLRLFRPTVPSPDAVPQMRARTSEWISRWRLPLANGIAKEENASGWTVFTPETKSDAHVFYLHGGGLVFYSVEDFSSLMAHFASASGSTVTAFSYASAPEHKPHEIVELLATSIEQRLSQLPENVPVVLAGDSIGGYIALYLALRKFPGRFTRLVLVYPVLDLHQQRQSYLSYGRGYCLNADMMAWFQSLWHGQNGNHGEFSPFALTDADMNNLPETLVVSAEMDILRDEASEWCSALNNRQLPVKHHQMPGLAHDFCLYAGAVPEARAATDFIAGHLRP